jgi:hypothetical protein
MKTFYSTEIDVPNVPSFGWHGEVLMANKLNMQEQIIVRAYGTYNVEKGHFGLHNVKLQSFPKHLHHTNYEIIGWRTISKQIKINYNE